MKTSNDYYVTIFENTGAASIVINQDYLILLVNKKFEKLSCYGRDEIEGKKKWTEFVVEEDLPKVKECTWQQEPAVEDIKDECEFRFINRLGDIKYIYSAITEIPDTNTAILSLLDITKRKLAEEYLQQKDLELEKKTCNLEEANTAMKVLLNHKQEEQISLEEQILSNIKKVIMPSIENMKRFKLNKEQIDRLKLIEMQLLNITSPFIRNMSKAFLDLTPREIQIASLIREGSTTKEIAKNLNITAVSVNFHRRNLRCKFGIVRNSINLRSYLTSSFSKTDFDLAPQPNGNQLLPSH